MKQESYLNRSPSELQKILHEKKESLGKLSFLKADKSQIKDTSMMQKLRKEIARIYTAINSPKS